MSTMHPANLPLRAIPVRRHHRARLAAALSLAVLVGTPALHAQSAQKYALQFSVLSTTIEGSGGSSIGGQGFEPQFRFNRVYSSESFGALSIGIGGQYTSHSSQGDELTIAGVFVEPRWVPNTSSTRFFPYLAGRLASLQQSNNFGTSSSGWAAGAGAGLAVKLTRTINLDGGVALVRQKFGSFVFDDGVPAGFNAFNTYAAKIGASVGFPSRARQAP